MVGMIRRSVAALTIVACALGVLPATAWAAAPGIRGLSVDDSVRLLRGETVTRPQTVEEGDFHYVGGITYTIVDAPPEELAAVLENVRAYRQLLPRTKQAQLVAQSGPDFFVELRQGNALMETQYTLRARRDPAHHEVRFWLDQSRPHGIADAWGFFHYEAVPPVASGPTRTLLTYGILVDVGPGLVRALFEEKLRGLMLSVPQLVQRYVAEHPQPLRPISPSQGLAALVPN